MVERDCYVNNKKLATSEKNWTSRHVVQYILAIFIQGHQRWCQ